MVAKTEKKDEKTSLGNKILNYVPWRTALTVVAFAIPVAGPILGTLVGALAYGNYRKNKSLPDNEHNKSNNQENKRESKLLGRLKEFWSRESEPPSGLKKFLFRVGAVAIGFLLGGPVGAVIAAGFVAIDAMSNGKLIQGAEKVLDAGYDALGWVKDKTLDAGKWVVDRVRGSGKDGPVHGFDNPCYSPDVEPEAAKPRTVEQKSSAKESDSGTIIAGKEVKGEKSGNVLKERENSANQEQGYTR